jgi:DNA helicase-2/ATP-dependent DNA helicase PcrA
MLGPGSGKTRTMIGRVVHLLHSGIKPKQILALTFSRKAAREMKHRLLLMATTIPAAKHVLTRTIHAWSKNNCCNTMWTCWM